MHWVQVVHQRPLADRKPSRAYNTHLVTDVARRLTQVLRFAVTLAGEHRADDLHLAAIWCERKHLLPFLFDELGLACLISKAGATRLGPRHRGGGVSTQNDKE